MVNGEKEADASVFNHEYPLTQGQAALWFHYKLAPESVAYNLAGAVTIPGDTDLEMLQRAFQKVAERHPMLRTLFTSEHGKPVQIVHPSMEIAFKVQDASEWDMVEFDHRLAEEIYRRFDLEHGPNWRVMVFRQAPVSSENDTQAYTRDHVVLLVLHHIIVDLWSIAIILSEVIAIYREETNGVPARLRSLRFSYADYIKKELEQLAGTQAGTSWNYWRTVLSGDLSRLNLPFDQPPQTIPTGRGAVYSILLEKKLTQELRLLAEKHHIALYAVLLAAFQTLLHRYTGQDDILVGFPKARRNPSTVYVVGYFVNQMVVRSDFSENPAFIDLLKSVQKSLEESARHDWYPFSLLVQHLQPDRDLSRSPLIQAVFAWQQAPRLIPQENAGPFLLGQSDQTIELEGLPVRSFHLPNRVAPFDLIMLAAEAPEGLTITIEYASDLFEAATIARMAENYRTLLESITTASEKPVSDLTLLPEPEGKKLIELWNATAAPYPAQACLHQLFEEQAERTPEIVAVISREEQINYHQLNLRANQLAHYLQEQGVGPNSLVGVYLEPCVQMVIGLLGILKAGGAYLPLDPANPRERLAFMLADAHPTWLLTRQALSSHLPDFAGKLFLMDADGDELRTRPQSNPTNLMTSDHLAYVIYTSGSTGQPKGIGLAHRGVVNLLTDFQRRQAIQPGDACSWWTSPGFDVSVYEIFSPLLAGGTLQVIPENLRLDATGLMEWLHTCQIRSAYLPPFFLKDFAAWLKSHPDSSALNRLLVGVEPIPDVLLNQISEQLPSLSIINGYGPTETTICSTLYPVDAACPHPGNAPIGKPVANTQIYLLDRALQPVPIGVVGELYIGGVGLAQGYLNLLDLTAQRFIQSPFRPGERLYRTGDRARYLPDGNLVFVGRSDDQVKIHGVRIELGEIEAALLRHPQVKQAAVRLHEQPSGSKYLVAYVIPSQDPPPPPEELHRFLSQQLPHTMVPSTFITLDAFPLTTTGKVDRKALLVPQEWQARQAGVSRAPRNHIEQALIAIWQEVLGVEPIGVEDSFFELGGDSIMSLQIVARAAELGIHLKLHHIFQAPTIAGLAALADTVEPEPKQGVQEKSGDVFPLTPIQKWFFDQNLPNPHHWNQSLMFITPQPLDPAHLRAALSALVKQHEALRMRYVHGSSGWQQTYMEMDIEVPFEVMDLSNISEVHLAEAIEARADVEQCSLNLTTGPLIRVVYFMMGMDVPGHLLIVIHHLAVDGVSWRIILEDLQTAYRQHEQGQPIRLLHKTTAFYDWARRLAGFAQSEDLDQEATFWLYMVGSRPRMLPGDPLLPDLSSQKQNTEGSVTCVSVFLGREETQVLLREAPDAYGTDAAELLITALARAFQRWAGGETLWIDLEAHGREAIFDDIDLTRTVGWFTSLYPICLDLPHQASLDMSIKEIKEQLRSIPHHGLGFGLLRYLCGDPDLSDQFKFVPAAPLSFNYLGQLPQSNADSLFSDLASEPIGYQRSPDALRSHLIEINAAIYHGELHIDWYYSSQVHTRDTIEEIANLFIEEVHALIAHCRSVKSMVYTPSDFPGANLSQVELDTVLQTVTKVDPVVSSRNLEAIYPLSPMQQGMVFHTLYTPESGIYFEQTTFTVQGRFDVTAYQKAWQRVIDRHPILRTSFAWEGLEQMLQIVHKEVKVPVERQDWRGVQASVQRARLDNLFITERRRGFDLSAPPLLRLQILQTANDTYHILLNHHHALLDGWSVSLLFKEVFAFYDAFTRSRDLTLPPARPYKDYINWLQAQDLSIAEAFWRKELAGSVPFPWTLSQPSPLPPTGAFQPAELEERLPIPMTTALQTLTRQQHLTLSTLFQGAWAILLSRYFKRDETLFGITVAGRPTEFPGILSMIGLFINTLPLRVKITPHVQLLEWLRQIQDKAIEIQQYTYSSLAHIKNWSGMPRNYSLFDSLLVFENYPAQTPIQEQPDGLQIGNVRSIEQATYPLTVAITPGTQLNLRILYDPAHFELSEIRQILDDLHVVLQSMITNPSQNLSRICQVALSEHHGLSKSWSRKTKFLKSQSHIEQLNDQLHAGIFEKGEDTQVQKHVPPTSPLEKYLARQWQKILKKDPVGVNDNFFELGGDSLAGTICTYQLLNAMQETIPLPAIFEAPTISELARYLEQNHPAGVAHLLGIPVPQASPLEEVIYPTILVPIQPKGSKHPLFCIHPAGGIVFPYYTLATYLDKDRPVYGIQDPSLYNTQLAPQSIEDMAAGYLEAIKTDQPEGPYHLMGWSAGGLIAYEMAQQLVRHGQMVEKLILLDTLAPAPAGTVHSQHLLKAIAVRIQGTRLAIQPISSYIHSGLFLLAASRKHNRTPPGGKTTIADLLGWAVLDTWRATLLREEAEVASAVTQETSLLLIKMPAVRRILERVREHRRLAHQYAPQSYPGQIILFRAEYPESKSKDNDDPMMGWGRLAGDGVEVHILQANHVALFVKPHVEVLAQELRKCLDKKN